MIVAETNQQSLNVITLQNPPITPFVLIYIYKHILVKQNSQTLKSKANIINRKVSSQPPIFSCLINKLNLFVNI